MKKACLLDCTLREAPIDGLMWGEASIHKMISGLENAGADIIEVGFLKNEEYVKGSTIFHHVEDIETYLCDKKSNTMYVALVDYGRYDLSNLAPFNGRSIDAIRVCFKHDQIGDVLDYASEIVAKGYKVSIQHVDTMGFSDDEIIGFVKKVNALKPYAYAIVDTFGAMYEEDMVHYARLIDSELATDIKLGFHGHDNLLMANANAQRFIMELSDHREVIVDTSLYGCGRGAGNAHTELVMRFLIEKYKLGYDINEVLDLIDTVISAVQTKTEWGYNIPYFISGMYNAHTFNVKHLMKRHNLKSKDLRGIIDKLDDSQKKMYDYALLEKLYVQYFDRRVDDAQAIKLLNERFNNREILLLAPGQSVRKESSTIKDFIQNHKPIIIAINNVIDDYELDYIFYSGAIRYQNFQFQHNESMGKPELILTSNIVPKGYGNEIVVNYMSLIKFGWVNLDSSAIMLIRLLIVCGVSKCYVAGLDGYKNFGYAFYKNELDTGLAESDRIEHTKDNLSMLKDIKKEHPDFELSFITSSVYEEAFS